MASAEPILTVDIGNSRIKFGLFDRMLSEAAPSQAATSRGGLPHPRLILDRPTHPAPLPLDATQASPDRYSGPARHGGLDDVVDWLAGTSVSACRWFVGSVNRDATTRLVEWLRAHGAADRITLLCAADLPLVVDLPRPDMVGIDRLLAACAANHVREAGRPAVIVNLGSAIVVDLIAADGSFSGGAILPGIGLSARALHEFTDLLPRIELEELHEAPDPLGKSTEPALHAGLFYGAVGAARELIRQYTLRVGSEPQLFLTGGAAASVAKLLSPVAMFEPTLVLSGIALTAEHIAKRPN